MELTLNTNLMAFNASRNLNSHYNKLSVSVRRLSSGLRVGTAADDAAGLAIRELMRADIATLNQGVRNANDAISLLQTADGALQIVDEKLIRMKELAEQAATGTYDSTQRLMIDSEYQAMAREITRIGMATEFNGIRLLNGNLEAAHKGNTMGGTGGPQTTTDGLLFGGMLKVHFGTGNDSAEDYYYIRIFDTTTMYLGIGDMFSLAERGPAEMTRPFLMGIQFMLDPDVVPDSPLTKAAYDAALEASKSASEAFMREAIYGFDDAGHFETAFNETFGAATLPRDTSFVGGREGLTYAYLDGMDKADYPDMYEAYKALTGDEKEKYQYAFLHNALDNLSERLKDRSIFTNPGGNPDGKDFFAGVDAAYRDNIARSGIAAVNRFHDLHSYAGRNIRTQENAQHAQEAIDLAALHVSQNRARIGALQNRLENTISNLQIHAENLQAAESRISDVDVAEEMTGFVRSRILVQAATAMLAQANSIPQMALNLIQQAA
jgi:flagellin